MSCKPQRNKMSRGSVETMKYVDKQITTPYLRIIRSELEELYTEIIKTVDLDDFSKNRLQDALLYTDFTNEIREAIKTAMF
ncbi:hypothetical protein [Treponema sp.]|uniref:hypothetical protein n=1 Tax=Treponema sp. TaxID=166 RepID=UPI00298E5476|nr:hypothetical protein [Treponema sp.]MCQ2240443.1 hypothetical protein [Treponema sp.]